MADDEQFSLCWNNFNSNLSAGFHESLCRGDLVDVTLAAEGQFVKAHRLVLSVCSPYFRKMFTQMPANQHAFVFLKDVSHTALKDLIQFMYCGEVNVKQEALPAFISTAEALQIKGLTDSDPPASQSPAEPSTPTPQVQQITSPRVRQQRSVGTRSYKIETVEDPNDDGKQPTQIVIQTATPPQQQTIAQQTHLQQTQQQPQHPAQQIASTATTTSVVSHKRPAQRGGLGSSAPHIKRTKSTIDPLEVTDVAGNTQQISVQTTVVTADPKPTPQSEPEYIDLPIELPTKSEPDYSEEAGEVEGAEHDATYVEDDSFGELRYDETYFTENEDAGAAAAATNATTGSSAGVTTTSATTSKAMAKQQQTFSESSYVESGDQTNNDAQDECETPRREVVPLIPKKRGRPKIKQGDDIPREKLLDKLIAACRNNVGIPVLYASTTKGGMKLVYNGHHFRYSFRKGQFSIFQCCYKENREQCKVRVVSDQKMVYPLDGEHVHFTHATDKSVTSVTLEPDDGTEVSHELEEDTANTSTIPAYDDDIAVSSTTLQNKPKHQTTTTVENPIDDADDFREKIKRRLQKALLGKKK